MGTAMTFYLRIITSLSMCSWLMLFAACADSPRKLSKNAIPEATEIIDVWEENVVQLSKIGGFKHCAFPPTFEGSQAPLYPAVTSSCQMEGDFGLKTITSDQGNPTANGDFIFLRNPQYAARLKASKNGWQIESVITSENEEAYKTECREQLNEFLAGTIFHFVKFQDLRNCNDCQVSELNSNSSERRIMNLTFNDVTDRLKKVVFTVAEEHDWQPTSVLMHYGTTARQKEFSGWTEVNGLSMWTKEISFIPPEFDSSGVSAKFATKFDVLDRTPDRKQCYLTHYGLPEPPLMKKSQLPYWLLGVLGIATVAVVYWAKKANR